MINIKGTIVLAFLFHFLGFSQTIERSDKERMKLRGNVKSVTQRTFPQIERFNRIFTPHSNPCLSDSDSKFTFDKQGNLKAIYTLYFKGRENREVDYVQVDDELISKKTYIDSTVVNKYDSNGNLVETVSLSEG